MSLVVRDYRDAHAIQERNGVFQDAYHQLEYIVHRHPLEPEGGFTDAYFLLPNELQELFEKKGVQTLEMATCEGLPLHCKNRRTPFTMTKPSGIVC